MLKLILLAASLHAEPLLSADQVLKSLLRAQDRRVWLSCVVVREEAPEKGGSPHSVTGTLKVASGGRAILHIKEPSEQKAVSDGKNLWVEMADVKQVMKYDAKQLRDSGNFFLDLASSIRHYAKASMKRLIPAGDSFGAKKISALELMPLDPESSGFERMCVWVDTDDWVVRQVTLTLGGVENKVRFQNVEIENDPKKALDDGLFHYEPPKGYQVFDLISMQ